MDAPLIREADARAPLLVGEVDGGAPRRRPSRRRGHSARLLASVGLTLGVLWLARARLRESAPLAALSSARADADDPVMIDDVAHAHCGRYVNDSAIDAASCDALDEGLCHFAEAQCGGNLTACGSGFANCSCDGGFGPCALKSVANVDALCSSLSTIASSRAPARPRRAAGSRAPEAEAETGAPTPAPSYFVFDGTPDCDVKAYCEYCSRSTTCVDVLDAAHAGRIDGVRSSNATHHDWHAEQAVFVLLDLPAACAALS